MPPGTVPPTLQFAPNMPVQVYFPYGDYKMIPSKNKDWSESYKYNVEVNDVTHTLFATPGLHRELQIRSIGPQCYVLITRAVELDDNNKEITRWQVLNVDGSERPAVEFTPEPPAASPAAAPAAPSAPQTPPAAPQPQGAVMAAPGSREDARLVWRSCVTLMGVCIEQAQKIYTDAGYEIEKRVEAHDIHATATTLFIQVSRATDPTLLLKQEAAAPAPAPPPQPQPPAAPPSPQEAPANPADDDLPF
jgi:pyruvate/2-oxoglutarate dehydrogenase complex dihydrolipoamide acyltransferase (E2) component